MKEIYCKECGKQFVVSDRVVSDAERDGLCGQCFEEKNRHKSVKVLLR